MLNQRQRGQFLSAYTSEHVDAATLTKAKTATVLCDQKLNGYDASVGSHGRGDASPGNSFLAGFGSGHMV